MSERISDPAAIEMSVEVSVAAFALEGRNICLVMRDGRLPAVFFDPDNETAEAAAGVSGDSLDNNAGMADETLSRVGRSVIRGMLGPSTPYGYWSLGSEVAGVGRLRAGFSAALPRRGLNPGLELVPVDSESVGRNPAISRSDESLVMAALGSLADRRRYELGESLPGVSLNTATMLRHLIGSQTFTIPQLSQAHQALQRANNPGAEPVDRRNIYRTMRSLPIAPTGEKSTKPAGRHAELWRIEQ